MKKKSFIPLILCLPLLLTGCQSPANQLVDAVAKNDGEQVAVAVARGADVNAPVGEGHARLEPEWTPLGIAADNARVDAMRALIKAGADVNGLDGYGVAPLHYAAERRDLSPINMLLENGANVNIQASPKQIRGGQIANTGFTLYESPLIIAARNRSFHVIKALLKAGAKPDLRDFKGRTAYWHLHGKLPSDLEQRLEEPHREARRLLLQAGADPNPRNFEKHTWLEHEYPERR